MSIKSNIQVVSLKEALSYESIEKRQPVVLIVDDERVIADTLSIILSKSGFTVSTAYDGKSALEIAKAVTPELLISDVAMPGMDGVELAIALIKMMPECKVLLFSGQASSVDLLTVAHDSGYDFTLLTKPVHPTDMLRRVSECLQSRQEIMRPSVHQGEGSPVFVGA
jgi:DNA-binding NtrC family response regulator